MISLPQLGSEENLEGAFAEPGPAEASRNSGGEPQGGGRSAGTRRSGSWLGERGPKPEAARRLPLLQVASASFHYFRAVIPCA